MIEVVNCYFIEGREAAEVNRILLLEDDEALGRGICMALETSAGARDLYGAGNAGLYSYSLRYLSPDDRYFAEYGL